MKARLLSVYCISHFLVDLGCAFFILSLPYGSNRTIAFLIYNFCAFALQMPFGILADNLSRNAVIAAVGCILVALGTLIPLPFVLAVVIGIGNALFHVGGGVDALNMSSQKCSPLGLFVSPGAIGLCLGKMLCGKIPFCVVSAILLLAAIAILLTSKGFHGSFSSDNRELSLPQISPSVLLSVLCLFAVVALRSFAGMSFSFEWKASIPALITIGCIALGKAFGGFAADLLGTKAASILSLGVCAVLFLFSDNILCGLAALLLFNMTMPITLWETAQIFPNAKGFSFGLLTFALFIGFLPVYFGVPSLSAIMSAVISALSLILLLFGTGRKKNVI